jgi:excisionase family DNA binding protein
MPNMSVKAAAARLGIGEVTMRTYLRERRIPSLRIGRRRLVKSEALDAFEKEHAVLTEVKPKQQRA